MIRPRLFYFDKKTESFKLCIDWEWADLINFTLDNNEEILIKRIDISNEEYDRLVEEQFNE
jgi:hypothetical protein